MAFLLPKNLKALLSAVNRDRLDPDAILLSYLVADHYGIVRFPTHPDRTSDERQNNFHEVQARFSRLQPSELEDLKASLHLTYCYTQERLKLDYPGKSTITLRRSVGSVAKMKDETNRVDSPDLYPALVAAAQQEGRDDFELDVDILSGWSLAEQQNYGCLVLRRDWPKGDILLVSDHFDQPGAVGPMESDEWLCINRARNGLVTFNTFECKLNAPTHSAGTYDEQANRIAGLLRDRAKHFRPKNLGIRPPPASRMHRCLSWIAGKLG